VTLRALLPGLLLAVLLSGCSGSSPSDVSAGPARTTTGQPSGRVVAVGPDLAVTVPPGWRVLRTPYPLPGVEPTSLCLVPRGSYLRPCAGVSFAWGPDLPGPRGSGTYRPDQPRGWDDGTELALCPLGDGTDNLIEPGLDRPTGSSPRAVGNHRAAWNQWHATCADGSDFDPQVWYLRGAQVLVKDLTGHGATARILASAGFRQDGATVPDEATHIDAWVTAVDGDTFTIRRSRATGASRDVDVSQAVCTGTLVVPGEIVHPVVPCGRFARLLRESGTGRVPALVWIDPDGTVAQVSEVFRT
jgi:hypothetical protein